MSVDVEPRVAPKFHSFLLRMILITGAKKKGATRP
jgi:hypothetical protein